MICLHDQKVGVWCAIARSRIIVPIFFEDTINSKRYISDILEPYFELLTEEEKENFAVSARLSNSAYCSSQHTSSSGCVW